MIRESIFVLFWVSSICSIVSRHPRSLTSYLFCSSVLCRARKTPSTAQPQIMKSNQSAINYYQCFFRRPTRTSALRKFSRLNVGSITAPLDLTITRHFSVAPNFFLKTGSHFSKNFRKDEIYSSQSSVYRRNYLCDRKSIPRRHSPVTISILYNYVAPQRWTCEPTP